MHRAHPPTVTYPELVKTIMDLPPSCGPVRVIAIDGPSGAGKTLLAARLARAFGDDVPVVGSDDFPVPWDGGPLEWWAPFTEQVLDELARGRPGRYLPYDWRHRTYGPARQVPVRDVLIVEGVGAAWRGCPAALRIWLDAPEDLRRERVLGRDGQEYAPGWDRFLAATSVHFTADRTRERAGLHLDGGSTEEYDPEQEIPLLLAR